MKWVMKVRNYSHVGIILCVLSIVFNCLATESASSNAYQAAAFKKLNPFIVTKKTAALTARAAWALMKTVVGLGAGGVGGYFWFIKKWGDERWHAHFVNDITDDLKTAQKKESDLNAKLGTVDTDYSDAEERNDAREDLNNDLKEAKREVWGLRLKKGGLYAGECAVGTICLVIAESGLRDLWQLWKEHKRVKAAVSTSRKASIRRLAGYGGLTS